MSRSIDRYVRLQGGFAIKSSDYRETGIPLIRISNISSKGLDKTNVIFVPKEYAFELKDYLVNEDDTLIAMSGATTGKCCLVKDSDLPCIINQRVGRFVIINESEVDKKFVYYIINSHSFQNELLKDAVGGAQPNVSPKQIEKINWDFPLFNQQQKIAQILNTADTVIEKTQTAIAKYKAIKQGMLNDLFTRGIDVKTGKLRAKQEDAPELYKESALGWIPKEWEDKCLSSLCSERPTYGINAAAVDYTHQLPTYLRITDIDENGNFSKTRKKCVDSPFSNQYILKKGDLVFARTGATVGKTYLYNESDGQLVFAGFLIKVSPNERLLDSNFLKFLTETPYYLGWVEVMSQRSGQPGINGIEYGSFLVPKPNLTEQKIISERLLSIQNKISFELKYLIKLQQIKSGLMADLLSGKKLVTVPAAIAT